jgi:type I restriction enzyme S subunit
LTTDIVSGHINWTTVPYVAVDATSMTKYRLDDGDIVLARTGASTGASCYVKRPPPAVFASYLVRLKAKPDFDSRFLAYWLKSDAFSSFLRGVLGDKSAQPNASASTMTQAPLHAPKSKNEQRAIAYILGTLDDKIDLNRRMNETLEAMAQALFKSWFVDFDPVRAKMEGRDPGLPAEVAALFPERLVDSEWGEIPEGWMVAGLDEVATYLNGLALQKYPEDGGDSLPVIKIAQLRAGTSDGADRASAGIPAQYVVKDGDVLFSWSGSLQVELWCGGPGALNQHLFKVASETCPKWLYFYWTKRHLPDFQAIAAGKATTMGHIQRHHLAEAKVLLPPAALLCGMDAVVSPILNRMIANTVECRTLAAVRDALLPKLISGAIRLKDARGFLEEACP